MGNKYKQESVVVNMKLLNLKTGDVNLEFSNVIYGKRAKEKNSFMSLYLSKSKSFNFALVL